MSRRQVLAAAGGLGAGVGSLSGCADRPADDGDVGAWPLRRRDAARTGYNPATDGPAEGRERWRLRTGSGAATPVTGADTVYVDSDGVYALDAGDGAERWHRSVFFRKRSAPAVSDGTIYAAFERALYAIAAPSGEDRWFTSNTIWWYHCPVPAAGTLYLGASKVRYSTDFDARVLAVSAGDAAVRWEADVGTNVLPPFAPAVAAGTVYAGRDRVYALDRRTGEHRWMFAARGHSAYGDPAVADGTVYVGGVRPADGVPEGSLFAIDARTGAEQWRYETGLVPTPPAVGNGVVYTTADAVYALDADDGTVRWRHDADRFVTASPAATPRHVYVAGIDGVVRAFDAVDGRTVWRLPTDGALLSDPSVVDDAVFVGSANGRVLAVGA